MIRSKRNNLVIIGLLILFIILILYLQHANMINFHAGVRENMSEERPAPPTIIIQQAPPAVAGDPIARSPKEINAIDRFWNPLRYPYRSDYFYDQNWYPQNNLPFQVIGGGRRMAPTLGGTEVPIANPSVPINISEAPIAPINISTRGPLGRPQQLGIIYRVKGDHNTYLPLFGLKMYPNSNDYRYYTSLGINGNIKVPIITRNKNVELSTGDEVKVEGQSELYRVSLYESDFPQYIPYV